jgi:hypothetical protein
MKRESARGRKGDIAREKDQTMVHKLIFIVVFPELGKKKAAAGRPDLGGLSYWLAGLLHPFWSWWYRIPRGRGLI